MNNKLNILNGAYKKALGAILSKEFPHIATLAVADVLIDPSGRAGRVWLSTTAEILKAVELRRGDIQNQLKKHVATRYTPSFSFLLDDKYLDRIDNLFNEIHHLERSVRDEQERHLERSVRDEQERHLERSVRDEQERHED